MTILQHLGAQTQIKQDGYFNDRKLMDCWKWFDQNAFKKVNAQTPTEVAETFKNEKLPSAENENWRSNFQ